MLLLKFYFYYIFKYFLTALQEPNIPTSIPIIINNNEDKYTNGVGLISFAKAELNNFPSKKLYKEIYPYIVIIIGIIEPISPKNNPSITNGILIDILDAPTSLIISISRFLANIANLIVLAIKNAVTITKAKTPIIETFLTTSNIVIS